MKNNDPDSFPIPVYRNEIEELKAMIEGISKSSSTSIGTPSVTSSTVPSTSFTPSITASEIMTTLIEIESKSIEIAKSSLSHRVDSPDYADLLLVQAETIAKHIKRRIGLPEAS